MMSEPILRARGICKDYRDGDRTHRVLHELDLVVRRGEFVAIMGPSGCGKTTLLNVLGLLAPPTEADRLEVDRVDCLRLSDRDRTALRRERIGFVFQRFNLLSTISAAEIVRLAGRLKGIRPDGQADRALDRVGLGRRAASRLRDQSLPHKRRGASGWLHRPFHRRAGLGRRRCLRRSLSAGFLSAGVFVHGRLCPRAGGLRV